MNVTIRGEQALIVWDEERGVEHFIRRADFDTQAKAFGFIVPTPTQPELAEIDDIIFFALESEAAPEIVEKEGTPEIIPSLLCATLSATRDGVKSAPAVDVLHYQRVAGYDAVVLDANDAGALVQWLHDNQYAHSEALKAWAQHYIDAGWKFTAFKLVNKDEAGLSTSAVRMTFKTDRPFYPYREPESQRTGTPPSSRALKVYFIAAGRYAGELEGGKAWPGETEYARPLTSSMTEGTELGALVKQPAWLTFFVDLSNPRPGTADLFFDRVADDEVVPEPIVQEVRKQVLIPGGLIIIVIAAGIYVWRRRRRR